MNGVLWFLLGLTLGMLVAFVISLLLWRRWAGERQDHVFSLQASLSDKEQDLRGLNELLQEQKTTAVQLRDQVSHGETRIGALAAELEEQKAVAGQLLLAVSERDGEIEGLKASVEEAQAKEAVETVLGFLRDKLPSPAADQVEAVLEGDVGGVVGMMGGLFGKE